MAQTAVWGADGANPAGGKRSLWRRFWSRSNERAGYLFILPSLIHLIVFLVVPLVFSLILSFHDWRNPNPANVPYVGLENYEFLMGDRRFWASMSNTLYYTVLAVPLGMAVSLGVALVLNQKLRGVYLFRTLFFMPVVSSWVAVSVIWITLLDPTTGIVNYLLAQIGIAPVNWLGDPRTAMPAIVIITIWKGMGFNMVIWLAGLQAIPQELYEAASIDGANRVQTFRFLTLPLLAPTSMFMAITGVIGSFQVFSPIYVITKGGPLGSTDVAVFHIYQRAFQNFDFGYAAAMAWVLFAVIFTATVFQLWLRRRRGEEIMF
ncbi:MAG: sugar ABC transporter permease [Chloroflexota bacterium]|nr:sugar ABC transporter permease [Chloroflexota bacterium]